MALCWMILSESNRVSSRGLRLLLRGMRGSVSKNTTLMHAERKRSGCLPVGARITIANLGITLFPVASNLVPLPEHVSCYFYIYVREEQRRLLAVDQ